MKNKNLIYTLLFAFSLVFTSCLVDDEEKSERDFDTSKKTVKFEKAAKSANFVTDLGTVEEYKIPVFLSSPSGSDITINWAVVAGESSATAGVEYDFVSSSPLVIPAGLSFGQITVNVNTANLDPDDAKNVVIELSGLSNSGYVVSENYKKLDLTLQGICAAELTGTYLMTNSVCASAELVEITNNGDGTFTLSQGDGGLLNYCSTNDIVNEGVISVLCGGVVPAGDTDYCGYSGGAIGCIDGGQWDAVNEVLTLNHSQGFFGWAPANYTSTYTKQ